MSGDYIGFRSKSPLSLKKKKSLSIKKIKEKASIVNYEM